MRPWLLLVSLYVSDLSPLGDGDRVVESYSWGSCRRLPLNGQMTPLGLEILQTQTEQHCMCIQRSRVCVAVQRKQKTPPFHWAGTVHSVHREFTGRSHRNPIPALVVSLRHGEREIVPAERLIISEVAPTKAGGEAVDIMNVHPDAGWSLHRRTAAPGRNFQASLVEKSKSLAPATNAQLQKMLTKRYCAATAVIISCCFKEGGVRLAVNIKKISKEQSTQRARDVEAVMQYDGQRPSKAVVSQLDIFQAAPLHSGGSSVETSDVSQLEIQRNAARIMKKNEHLNSDEEQNSVQKQRPLKAASPVYDNDGINAERQLLLESGEKTASINGLQYKMKATQDDEKEDVSGEIIRNQAELRRPESETEQSHTNTVERAKQKGLACILKADFTDDNDADHKQMLTEVAGDVLIMLLLPDAGRETGKKPILNTDTGWKTVNTPTEELDDRPHMTKVIEVNSNSKCKCVQESPFPLEMFALDKTQRMHVKPAARTAKETTASAYTEGEIKGTAEETEHAQTNDTPQDNTSTTRTKQKEESVTPSPPSVQIMKTETAKTERRAETTAADVEIKEATSSATVPNQGSTQKADGLPSTEEAPTATARSGTTNNDGVQAATATTGGLLSGLRMREDVPAAGAVKTRDGTEDGTRAAAHGPESKRAEDDPRVDAFTVAKPSRAVHQRDAGLAKATDDNMPRCGGLIHRTEAGWKHCVQRSAGLGSKMLSSREATDAFKVAGELGTEHRGHKSNTLDDDAAAAGEYDHFYYFDGALRRVQSNFYPYSRRQTRRRSSHGYTASSVSTVGKKENLPGFMRRLTSRNKARGTAEADE